MSDNPWLARLPVVTPAQTPTPEPVERKRSGPVAKYPLATMGVGDMIDVPVSSVPGQSYKRFRVFLSNKGWYLDMKFKSELVGDVIKVERVQ